MAIDLVSIKNLLLPDLDIITGKYNDVPDEWGGIFKTKNATKAVQRAMSVRFLGLAQQKQELGSISYDNEGGERYVYNMTPITMSIGYIISREALEDNLYQADFNGNNLGLQRSMKASFSGLAADIFNSATTYDADVGGDGKALLATDHPNDLGTVANTHTTPMALNEAAIIAGIKLTRTFVDEGGIKITVNPKKLIIPSHLEEVAIRLLMTTQRPGTADNDTNAIPKMGLDGYEMKRYLTGDHRWFITTDADGLVEWQRRKFESDIDTDFDTESLKVKATERKCYSCYDWRALVGENVTA